MMFGGGDDKGVQRRDGLALGRQVGAQGGPSRGDSGVHANQTVAKGVNQGVSPGFQIALAAALG